MSKRVQVVLNKAVNKLGHPGDVVDVAPGYARNFLIPQGLALQPTPGILKQAERRRAIELLRLAELKQQSEAQKATLDAAKGLSIAKQVGENEAIFGTVTNQDVADAIKAATSLEIDRRTISVPDIHTLGSYKAEIKLHSEVTATVEFEVVAS
jgi:large subunit ribosomal protein L9